MDSWKRADPELRDKWGRQTDEVRWRQWSKLLGLVQRGDEGALCSRRGKEMRGWRSPAAFPFITWQHLSTRGAASQKMQAVAFPPELASPRQTYRLFTQLNSIHCPCESSQQPNLWCWQHTQGSVSLVTQAMLLMTELLLLAPAKKAKVASCCTDRLKRDSLSFRE